ncbi:hypothetical protein [Nonomuraea sp. NPDC050643]|uniref:hypothetical protein n=1 Tax=Nonomuraea sp. NPDC050643 TaxID=3155660 RepID=UPI0033C7AE3E
MKIIAAVAVILTATLSAPAHAGPGSSTPSHDSAHAGPHDAIRYASLKGCKVKSGGTRPCGDWRLVLHSGERVTLPDAQGVALQANGKSSRYYAAAIAVSGNGQRVAYFTKKGRLAVRTLGGGVRLLAKDALPRMGQWEVTLRLSDDGSRLAASPGDGETRIFDTGTGDLLGTAPAEALVMGFSADADELLATVDASESVTELVVYGLTGDERRRFTPPKVIAMNAPQALAADGRTVASVVAGSKAELVTYDAEGDRIAGREKVKLPAGDVVMVDWTGDTQVTVHLSRYAEGGSRMTVAQIDSATGAVRVRDRYTLLPDTYVFAACGG